MSAAQAGSATERILATLVAIAADCPAVGGFDLTGFVSLFPVGVAKFVAIIHDIALAIVNGVLVAGNYRDDEQKDDFFPGSGRASAIVLPLLIAVCILGLP